MRLRLRGRDIPNGTMVGAALTGTARVCELKAEIEKVAQVPPELQILKAGFPLRRIDTAETATLADVGIADGDQITLEIHKPGPDTLAVLGVPVPGTPAQVAQGTDAVQLPQGMLVIRPMPDDNSCLFRALSYVLHRTTSHAPALRRLVADSIRNDPDTYTDAVLGRPLAAYVAWIEQRDAWGGAIELAAISAHYRVEIACIDVQTGRPLRFGEDACDTRVIVLFNGIHYDALALVSPADRDAAPHEETRFPVVPGDDSMLQGAVALAAIRRGKREFTDLERFTLKCRVCSMPLKGEKAAVKHAKDTSHAEFDEYQG
ncbi:hypothetical protein SeMB42_g02178 [Synchytrium endobioticum]|uniref:Ubiquitin thioesterase OTU n=1 Tax=Synchytrium endobioticum TaxID=286115 RepID=A0A507D6Z8_9FUNG|nr:hypothetical protein SeLEV6574_g02837 [Synchytrium endobioticum]TPX50647.1 hypothetical protein SeMB42_g02178 [Synchytrium endobioticum]